MVKRNLDNVYFRVLRDGKWDNVCFSDLTRAEQDKVLENRSEEWLKNLLRILCKGDSGNWRSIRHCKGVEPFMWSDINKKYFKFLPIKNSEKEEIGDWIRRHELAWHWNIEHTVFKPSKYEFSFTEDLNGEKGFIKCSCGAKYQFRK